MFIRLSPFLILLSVATSYVAAVVTDKLGDLPKRPFDFVVVGAGAGGSVIANRLTEDPEISVLLIEAGGSNEGVLDSACPGLSKVIERKRSGELSPEQRLGLEFYMYLCHSSSALNDRILPVARGFILGGTTSINQMAYTRGSSEDYDRWARITEDEGWKWDNLQPFIRRNEHFTTPADHHNTAGQFDPRVHNFDGMVSVSLAGFPGVIDNRTIATTRELKDEFPFNLDMNSGFQLGIGWVQGMIGEGTRSSAATSYLASKFLKRKNLHVLINTRVLRVLETDSRESSFRTVEFTQDAGKTMHTITASKEVVLSGGSIMTPHILMHSGIGDTAELKALGIKTVHHLPSVGKNLTEQPIVRNHWLIDSTQTLDTIARNATLLAEVTKEWEAHKMGPLVDPPLSFIGWLRLPKDAAIFKKVPDPAAGPKTSHYELIFANGALVHPAAATGNFFGVSTSVSSPTSRGSITLNSSNPLAYPLINFNLLSSDFDRFTIREAIRITRKFMAARTWDGFVLAPPTNATTDDELDVYINQNAATENHPVGTAAMSSKRADYGVLDPDLTVKGLTGLRVVDASIFPRYPAAHTSVPVYIVAERAADLIKEKWRVRY
ncbi:hypothetical protein D9757_008203 [Collybiopsis confluens]|uniref:Glucose-methanol-choline oxidoreductase N-terminal domain-containing protein n=1 Tax=Collybiopsis confluens TaxID=2823264 RepID=A0A8H5HBJ7_9AGAR|nr:hypothetical protein D9757_008203 [Collybiopsis confluens]